MPYRINDFEFFLKGARSYEVRLNCSLIAGRYDYEPLVVVHTDYAYVEYSARLQYAGVRQLQYSS